MTDREVMQQAEPSQWRDMIVVSLVREGIDKHKARELADHFAAQPVQQAEPICPECKAAAVLYECVACSSNNYPPKQQAEPPQRQWVGLTGEEKALIASVSLDVHDAVHRAEAKLKERNT